MATIIDAGTITKQKVTLREWIDFNKPIFSGTFNLLLKIMPKHTLENSKMIFEVSISIDNAGKYFGDYIVIFGKPIAPNDKGAEMKVLIYKPGFEN